jgi:hypothetical protein
MHPVRFPTTAYFRDMRSRPDRAIIHDSWIARVIASPSARQVQGDSRIRLWGRVPEADGRWLRVVLLPDGETVHNAFFDRRFAP